MRRLSPICTSVTTLFDNRYPLQEGGAADILFDGKKARLLPDAR
jgi:hypothetical protein